MIFVRIDNISNRLYAGVFKICTKGFWFSATALLNNIYVITIKQFSQFFFIGDNFVFTNKCCYIVISYETFIRKKQLHELPKTLIGIKPFSLSFLRSIFIHSLLRDTQRFLCFLYAILFVFVFSGA